MLYKRSGLVQDGFVDPYHGYRCWRKVHSKMTPSLDPLVSPRVIACGTKIVIPSSALNAHYNAYLTTTLHLKSK